MFLPFVKKTTPPVNTREYFFALEIDQATVKGAIWTSVNSKPQVLSISSRAGWDSQTPESLIQACDKVLTEATEHLDATGKIQPQKVILGLPQTWIAQEKILPDRLKILKILSQKLSLNAVGFVVTVEATVRHLQTTEGSPVTSLLIGFWPTYLEVTLCRLGKIEATYHITRSPQLIPDVIEGLSRFSHIDLLPSRMLLYDGSLDLEEIRQALLAHPWQAPQTRLPFLHFPKIELLPTDYTLKAIALAGGKEIVPPGSTATPPPVSPVTPAELGFYEGEDLTPAPSPISTDLPSAPAPAISPSPPRRKIKIPRLSFPRFRISLPNRRLSPLVILLLAVLIVSGLFAAYWFLPRATVSLTLEPKTISPQLTVTTSSQINEVDIQAGKLPSKLVEVSVSLDKTSPTTGTKLIGDKATGSVTIINGTPSPRTFPAKTTLTSPSGLIFTTDSEVQIASASGTADPNSYKPGQAAVPVTASQIGSDSNLSAGTSFKIGNFSSLDFVAKNEAAFSGGSSQQVKAVSKADVTDLKNQLTDSLKSQALTDLAAKVDQGDVLVPESVTYTNINPEFSHQADETADELSLRLSLKAVALVFSTADLADLVSSSLDPLIPEGYEKTSDIKYQFQIQKTDAGATSLSVQVNASLLPQLDANQISQSIAGKYPSQAQEYLSSLPSVSSTEFTFTPPLPGKLLTLPHVPSRIRIQISPKL